MDNKSLHFCSSDHPKVSIVTCFNNREVLEENLLRSLRQQSTVALELVAMNNVEKNFVSVSSALNTGGQTAKGDYIIFVHQDVYLSGANWINRAVKFLDGLPDAGVAGVCGVTSKGASTGFILDRGRYWGRRLSKPIPVQTLDEQLVIVPRRVFEKTKFDERFRFHSYTADFCLSIQKIGLHAYVLPLMVEHNSPTTAIMATSSLNEQDTLLFEKCPSYKLIQKTTGTIGGKRNALRRKLVSRYPDFLFRTSVIILKLWLVQIHKKSILDVGCSPLEQHTIVKYLRHKKYSVGISQKRRYLIVSKTLGIHDDYVIANPEIMPFKADSFDIAISIGLLEYLPKKNGELVIQGLEEVAKSNIVRIPIDGSPIDTTHMIFNSLWNRNDFTGRNYRTFTIGSNRHRFFPCTLFAYKRHSSFQKNVKSKCDK